jgi:hypothetical protein
MYSTCGDRSPQVESGGEKSSGRRAHAVVSHGADSIWDEGHSPAKRNGRRAWQGVEWQKIKNAVVVVDEALAKIRARMFPQQILREGAKPFRPPTFFDLRPKPPRRPRHSHDTTSSPSHCVLNRLHLPSLIAMSVYQSGLRCCARAARAHAPLYTRACSTPLSARRWNSTEADAAVAPTNPKIATIVDQVSQLTLLETADLVSALKVRCTHTGTAAEDRD